MIKLSNAPNRKSSYKNNFKIIVEDFRDDVILPIQTNMIDLDLNTDYLKLLDRIKNKDENEYIKEALGCLNNNFLKASIILGWCATIYKIHNTIEQIGFDKFNATSLSMKSQPSGRYKNFNQNQNVSSISDLGTVFDNILLWIIEGMGLIDTNQHARLKSCFDMRCHSGHPGEAPITIYNAMSFFSDIIEIVLVNPKFNLNEESK